MTTIKVWRRRLKVVTETGERTYWLSPDDTVDIQEFEHIRLTTVLPDLNDDTTPKDRVQTSYINWHYLVNYDLTWHELEQVVHVKPDDEPATEDDDPPSFFELR